MKNNLLEKIIFVEDNQEHINDLTTIFGNDIRLAQTFKEFESELELGNVEAILSDLYFPLGYAKDTTIYQIHKNEILDILNEYIDSISKKDTQSPIYKVIKLLTNEGVGTNLIETVNNLEKMDTGLSKMYEYVREVIGVTNENMKKYLALKEDFENDNKLLPEGLFVSKIAKERNIPSVIVTSSYHHDTDFQPFTNYVGRYFDTLKNGRKMWKEAYDRLFQNN